MVKVKQCESCGLSSSSSTFKNMEAFNNHFESHQSNLKCHEKDWDKTFATRAKLKWHRKTVHATSVNCQCCNKVFNTSEKSEEVVEAAHAKFDKFWQRYKVIDVESDKHGENLLQCVIDFVTKNI